MAKKQAPERSPAQAVFDAPQDILMDAPIGIFTSTPEGRYISANPALARMYGFDSPKELIDSITDIATQVYADPEDRKGFIRLLEEHGKVTNHESRFRRKDGTIFWVSRNVQVVRDQSGSVVAYQGFTADITDRKRAESALQERNKELNCLYGISKLIEQEDNPEKILQGVADLMPKGWQHSEVACARIIFEGRQYQTGNFRETDWRQSVDLQVHGQPVGMIDLCYLEERPVMDDGPFLKDERNLINAIAERLSKVIERKRTEEHLQQVLDATNDGIWDYDLTTGRFACSERFAQMLGYKSDEIQDFGCFCEDNIHPEDAKRFREAFEGYVHGRTPAYTLECRLKTKEGKYKWIYTRGRALRRDAAGRAMRVVGAHTDITERKRAEHKLKEKTALLEGILDNTPDILSVKRPDQSLVLYNKAGYEFLGMTRQQVQDKKCFQLIGRNKPCQPCVTLQAIQMKKMVAHEIFVPELKMHLDCRANTILNEDGEVEYTVELIQDITARKKAEEDIRLINQQLEKANAEKDMLFSIIAHDLKAPMSGLLASTEMLADQSEVVSEQDIRTLTREMHKSTRNTFALLEDLLQWSRMSQGGINYAPTPCSLSDLFNMGLSTTQDLAKSKEIDLRLDIAPSLTVKVDQPMIKTVIRNILFNAIKFTPRQGEIVITARQEGQNVTMAIQDNGIGMNEQVLSLIFTQEKRKRHLGTEGEKGTGLGLVLCKQFIEQHGGKIWVKSELGKGTTVFFTLPVSA
jgi:PAS domain S-box-containing protein